VVACRGVEDVEREYERIPALGARKHKDIQDQGGDIRVAFVAVYRALHGPASGPPICT